MTGLDCVSRRTAVAAALSWAGTVAWAHASNDDDARLPVVGPAPDFALVAATGQRIALADLHGKVLAVTFIFTTCSDTCPLLTAKLAEVQRRLGADFGKPAGSGTSPVDPLHDPPARLRV